MGNDPPHIHKNVGTGGFRGISSILVVVLLMVSVSSLSSAGEASAVLSDPKETRLISITESFPVPEVIKVRGYHRVIMDGLDIFGKPGEPLLPIKTVRVLIPFNSKVKEVRVLPGRKVFLGGSYFIEPGQMPVPLSSQEPVEPTLPDERIYGSSSPFPAKIYSNPFIQSKRGYRILWIRQSSYTGCDDDKIIELAKRNKSIILTLDKDFGRIYYFRERRKITIFVIRVKPATSNNIIQVLSNFLRNKTFREFKNCLCIITRTKVRIIC